MKKFILMLAIMFATVFTANAQIATENSKLFDNTYVGVEAGVTTPLDFNSVFPLNTVVGIKLGKELTPVFGFELEGQTFFNENNFTPWTNTFVKGTNVGLNGVTNLSNLFGGYKGTPRFFEVKANVGLSWLHYWNTSANDMLAKTGIDLAFNLGKTKAHTIAITPAVYWNLTGSADHKMSFNKHRAQLGVFASYVYHFKTSNGTRHFKTYDVGAMLGEIDRLNEELAKKPTEVVVEKVVTKAVPATAAVATVNATNTTVFFAFDSDELDDRAKAELDKLGENGIYCIDAYASSEGSTEYNVALSQRRADAVKAYLEGRGAKIESAVGHGVQFGTTTGRVAVVTVK
jgi:hypothetical protein